MILSADKIENMPVNHKTHFLNPMALRLTRSLGDVAGMKNIGVHLVELLPGKHSTELHFHHFEEECMYILSGSALATVGDQSKRVAAGDFIACLPHGDAHVMVNDGDESLQYLVIGQRLEQDITDYPNQGKRLYINGDSLDLVSHEHIVAGPE